MRMIRATQDLKLGTDLVKKGCLGVVNGHLTLHAALVTYFSPMGPVYETSSIPKTGFEDVEIPGDDRLALKFADRLRWSMDPADPFTNEVGAMMKEIIKGKPLAAQHLFERLTDMV